VHPEIHGLHPNREYSYHFRVGDYVSRTGRTRTTPAIWASPRERNFAFASCQAWQDGYFTAYRYLSEEDLDLVVHLGDYLYESGVGTNKRGVKTDARFHTETKDLARYRLQYGFYKSEEPLQLAHARFPWIMLFDNYEVENNWADETSENDDDPAYFLARRRQAFQAMYEHGPFRRGQLPSGPDVKMYRRLNYGQLANFTMLDTRQ
jgi:alkaline phosphatase D